MSNSSFFSSSGTTTSVENSIDTKVTAAEAAKVAAQAAQAEAETSAANAQTAADSVDSVAADAAAASSNAADALTYKNAAEAARDTTLGYRNTTETYKDAAASSASAASASETASQTAQAAAGVSETNAATSEANAASSASSASSSQAAAASSASSTASDAVSTAVDVVTTNADVVLTNADAASTAADRIAVAADKAIVAADKAIVNTDKLAAATSATAAAASQSAAAASAASAASAFDSFDDRYLGTFTTAAEPTVDNDGDALVTGALYFNSTEGEMRVYDGSAWIAASAATEASLLTYEYTATSGQTTFSGSDDNANTLSYTIDNIIVTLNGITLDPSDYTATSGTSIVLASGAALNDELNVVAFKSFTTADMVSATNGGTFGNDITVTGDLDVTGNVGIGTSSPSVEFEIASSAPQMRITDTDTNAVFQINASSTTGGVELQADATDVGSNPFLAFDVGGSEKVRILDSGNVGIGTSSPNANTKLDVNGAARIGNSTDGIMIENNSGAFDISNAAYIRRNSSNGELELTSGSTTARDMIFNTGTNGAESMRIDSSGNVGIGTSSPTSVLHSSGGRLNAPVLGASSSNAPLYLTNDQTNYGLVVGTNAVDGHVWLQAQKTDGTATAFDITLNEAGGNVGIGTSSPSTALDVTGTVTATAFSGDGSGLTGLSGGAVGLTDVGSFIMGRTTDTATRAAGTTLSASLVRYSNVNAQASGAPSGTLRVHGYVNGGSTATRTSVFQRIS